MTWAFFSWLRAVKTWSPSSLEDSIRVTDVEDAIRGLDDSKFGRQRRQLSVEWKKPIDRSFRRFEDGRRSIINLKPTKTLFVIKFDSYNTKAREFESHFEPYGKVLNVRIQRNFTFV